MLQPMHLSPRPTPECPRPGCRRPMIRVGDCQWICPDGHGEWLEEPEPEPERTEPQMRVDWLGRPYLDAPPPAPVSLAGPVDRRSGGSKSGRHKSPPAQKMDAWRRRRGWAAPLDAG